MRSKCPAILCPKCGKYGYITKRWVRSSYYPKYASVKCELVDEQEMKLAEDPNNQRLQRYINYLREIVRGNRYRGDEKNELIEGESVYRISSSKYTHLYIGHYDPKKYLEQMTKYRKGKRKSRPNGRRWCKLRLLA